MFLNADFAPTAGAAKGSMESKRYFLHTSLNQNATFDYQHGAPDRDFFIPPHPSGATPAPFRASVLCANYAVMPSGRGEQKTQKCKDPGSP